jgi:nucleoside-triphosphatase
MTGFTQTKDPQRIFLTGQPGSGKTTVLKRTAELLELHGFKVGGMVSKEIRERTIRTGFSIEDFTTHEEGTLAEVKHTNGPRVGKYTVNLRDLDAIGTRAIRTAVAAADVILIDELGPMELHSHGFIESVQTALTSQKHVLGTIHKHANHTLVMRVKSSPECTILEVTSENRGELPEQILRRITRTT